MYIFMLGIGIYNGSPGGSSGKESACQLLEMQETWVRSLDREEPLEKEMGAQSIFLSWEIPWTEEPDRLQSMGSQRIGHD